MYEAESFESKTGSLEDLWVKRKQKIFCLACFRMFSCCQIHHLQHGQMTLCFSCHQIVFTGKEKFYFLIYMDSINEHDSLSIKTSPSAVLSSWNPKLQAIINLHLNISNVFPRCEVSVKMWLCYFIFTFSLFFLYEMIEHLCKLIKHLNIWILCKLFAFLTSSTKNKQQAANVPVLQLVEDNRLFFHVWVN